MDLYVINLDRQTVRLDWMERGLRAAGVGFRRLRAVDGVRLSPGFVARRAARSGPALSRFELALIMSHRKAWRALLQSGVRHAAVLEDDVHIGQGFAGLLAALDEEAVPFDVLKLETVGERVLIDAARPRRLAGRDLCPLRSAYMGAAGYVLNRKAAERLLQVTRSLAVPVDLYLFDDEYLASNGLAVLQTVPGIVAQEEHLRRHAVDGELRSTLPQRGDREPREAGPGGARKLVREARRPLRQFRGACHRFWRMRREPGLRWGRIGFE